MDPAFFEFLAQLDCSSLKVFAQMEGGVVFPRVPLMRIEGPLLIAQLIETPLLTLVNYASLGQRTLPDIDSLQEKEQHFWSLTTPSSG